MLWELGELDDNRSGKQLNGSMLFSSYTLMASPASTQTGIVRRPRLERLLDSRVTVGGSFIITGPAGSGKSIIALQAALRQAPAVQYITARGLPKEMALDVSAPLPGGEAAVEIVNLLARPYRADTPDRLREAFAVLASLSTIEPSIIVIDDLDIVPGDNLAQTHMIVAEGFAKLVDTSFFFITRNDFGKIADFIEIRGQVQTLPWMPISILPGELQELIDAGSFGDATADQIQHAYEEMGGWFAGIKRILKENDATHSDLDDYVFYEILSKSSRQTADIIVAISYLPFLTLDLLQHLVTRNGPKGASARDLLSRLPLKLGTSAKDSSRIYHLPQVLAECFRRLMVHIGDRERISDLILAAIDWYISYGDFQAAKNLAIRSALPLHYLSAVRPYCTYLAAEEQWTQIRDVLIGMPDELLFEDRDYALWYMNGHSYNGNWEVVTKIRHAVVNRWSDSDDPLRKGRALLIECWRNWSQSRAEAALHSATLSYEALPADALQDRMFAAIAAENAARNLGEIELIDQWAARTGGYGLRMTQSPEFWHINCGYHRLNHLAMRGRLQHAYELSGIAMRQAPEDFPRSRFRYAILKSYIDCERGAFEAARENLELAASFVNGAPVQTWLELATANYLLRSGDLAAARAEVGLNGDNQPSRPDAYSHRMRILAEIELASNNVELADSIITNWSRGETSWPKYFGEPHPHILRSRVQAMRGEYIEAIATAQYVINESYRRDHRYYLVSALSIQAACYEQLGQMDRRDALQAAAIAAWEGEPVPSPTPPFAFGTPMTHRGMVDPVLPETNRTEKIPMGLLAVLTNREKEVIQAAADGMSTREIAETFFISQSTVKNHLASVFRKLGVNNRREAIALIFPIQITAG